MGNSAEGTTSRRAITVAATLLVVAALYLGRELLIPVFVAAFLAFLLVPVVRFGERRGLRRVSAVIVVVALGLAAVFGLGWVVVSQAAGLAAAIPQYRHNLVSKIQDLRSSTNDDVMRASQAIEEISHALESPTSAPTTQSVAASQPTEGAAATPDDPESAAGDALHRTAQNTYVPDAEETTANGSTKDDDEAPVKVEVVPTRPEILRRVGDLVAPVLYPVATAGITLVFVMFFLIYREDMRDRFLRVCGQAHINVTTAALAESAARVTRYLSSLSLVNAITGVAIGAGLFLIGVPNAALWGLLAGVLRFVPFLGPWVAAVFPLTVSIALLESWAQPLLVALWFVLIEAVCANVLEPWLYGARMGVSPVAVLFSFVFWTWLWGAVGLLLAMPITVCLVVLGKHIPAFEFLYILLGDEPVLEPTTRLYQRLLAMDRDEVLKICGAALADRSLAECCDAIVLPALAQIERDYRADLLDERRLEFVRRTMREVLALFDTERGETAATDKKTSGALLVPADGALGRIAAEVLAHALRPETRARVVDEHVLTSELVDTAREGRFDAIVPVALAPRTTRRLMSICKRIARERSKCDVLPVLVAFTPMKATRQPKAARRRGDIHVFESAGRLSAALAG